MLATAMLVRLPLAGCRLPLPPEPPLSHPRDTYGVGVSSSQMIDWNVAASTATRWVRPGPQVSLGEARTVVAELRTQAAAVAEPVREVTGLPGDDDGGKVAIVDRPGWIKANISGFQVVLDPLVEHMQDVGRGAGGWLRADRGRVPGHRHAGRADPVLPRQPGARSVRAVPAARPGRCRRRRRRQAG